MGEKITIDQFREKLRQMASTTADGSEFLMFEGNFANLDSIANNITTEICAL